MDRPEEQAVEEAASLPLAQGVRRAGEWSGAADACVLDHEGRLLRRRVLRGQGGLAFLADLPRTTSLDHGDALLLDDGRLVEIVAAEEDLIEVTGPELARLAWHVGNRHAPCQVEPGRLLIRADPVLRAMLTGLGASLRDLRGPFAPEGGAYGHGRTHAHAH